MGWQDKLSLRSPVAAGTRIQYGALCWRTSGDAVEVLLITSRDTGRWIIPKGWPMPGLSPESAAAQEAWQEAGVEGVMQPVSVGRYGYHKVLGQENSVPCAVAVYALRVDNLAETFPEMSQRRREWFPRDEAARLVNEPDLGGLIAGFTPPSEGRPAPIAGE